VGWFSRWRPWRRRHPVPGHGPITGAKPVAPDPQTARDMAAATGFPTATSSGGTEPLADRATPPPVGAARKDLPADRNDTGANDRGADDAAAGENAAEDTD
jgi:hypothetical protein